MTNIIMYNPASQHLYELAESDTQTRGRMEEAGFRRVERYDLVAAFNPSLGAHKTVLRADLQTWLNLGYHAEPTWVYHPEQPPRVVPADEAAHLIRSEGWYDSPAKVPPRSATAHAVPAPAAPAKPSPTPEMTKAQIVAFARQTYGLELDPELTKAELLAAVETAARKE